MNTVNFWRQKLLSFLRREELAAFSSKLNPQSMTRVAMITQLTDKWEDRYFREAVLILAKRCGVNVYIRLGSESDD